VLQGKVLYAGGWPLGLHSPSATVDIYDYASGIWSVAALSVPRMYMSAASAGPFAAFAGGLAADGDSDVVDIYDARSNKWTTSRLVQGMREGNAIGLQNTMLFYGAGKVQMLNAATLAWTIRNHSAEWAKMATASVGGRYALFAGGIGCPGNDCATVEIYDEKTDQWYLTRRNLTMARQYLMGAGGKHLAIFAGGINNTHNSTSTTDFFTLSDIEIMG